MALPLAPIAGIALRYGAVAVATYAVARSIERGHHDQRAEDAMDDIGEGATLRRDGQQTNGTVRFRRVIRMGRTGPAVEVDAVGFGRIRVRRL